MNKPSTRCGPAALDAGRSPTTAETAAARRRAAGDRPSGRLRAGPRRRQPPARIGAPARRRRGAAMSTTCPSSPARCMRRSACRRWRTAGARRSISTRCAPLPGVRRCASAPPTSPAPTTAAPIVHDEPIFAERRGALYRPAGVRWSSPRRRRSAPRRGPARQVLEIEPLPALLTPRGTRSERRQYVLPPMHLRRGDARRPSKPRRTAARRASRSAARSISISKARSPTPCRRSTAACWSTARPSTRARCSTWVAHALACSRTSGAGRVPAHGRRLRRQGNPVGAVRVRRRGGGAQAAAAGQAAARPRRRLPDHRQAPLLLRTTTRSASTTTGRIPGAELDDGLALPAIRPTCPARWPTARSATSTTPISWRTSSIARLLAARRTRRANTAFRGFGGPQGVIVDREHPRRHRPPRSAWTRSTCAAPTSTARRAQRHALRHDGRGQHHRTRWSPSSSATATTARGAQAIAAFNATQPGARSAASRSRRSSSASPSTSCISTRPARWCMSTPTAPSWSTTAAPRWARA